MRDEKKNVLALTFFTLKKIIERFLRDQTMAKFPNHNAFDRRKRTKRRKIKQTKNEKVFNTLFNPKNDAPSLAEHNDAVNP